MNTTFEDSLCRFERIEKEMACLTDAKSSSTPSSIFGPLNVPNFKHSDPNVISPMFQSTPQQANDKTRKFSQMKIRHNPQTPGGRAISPIAEERSEDLDKLVADVAKLRNGTGDKMVQNLVTQLRDLIAQWDWAQAKHRHVAKIYFERQQDVLNENWDKLHTEIAKFNQQKSDEWAKIASIRSSLQIDKAKASAKKDSERINDLEAQLQKHKSKELLSYQKLSEMRIKIKELEGEVKVREKSYNENMIKIRRCEEQLVRAEQENSNLRTKLTLMKAEKQQMALTQSQCQPNTQRSNQVGPRATLFNFCNSNKKNNVETSRIMNNTSSFGEGSSSSLPYIIRRNNSDNSFLNSHRQLQCDGMQNCQNMQSARPRVHFADQSANLPPISPSFNNASPINNIDETLSLNKRFELPSEMVNFGYKITKRGKEYTFSDGNDQIIVVELLGCKQPPHCRHCLLYEYITNNVDNSESSSVNDFRLISVPLSSLPDVKKHKIEIFFHHKDNVYEIQTPIGNIVRFFLSGQLEVCWVNGDRTSILSNGERREHYGPEKPDYHIEIYHPNGTAFRLGSFNQWQQQVAFVPNTSRMSFRSDGSYSSLHVKGGARSTANNCQTTSFEDCFQINSPDFTLRRFILTKAVKMSIKDSTLPGACLQLWLCIDDVLLVKHLQEISVSNPANGEQKHREKYVCFSRGNCQHISKPDSGIDRTMSFAMMQ